MADTIWRLEFPDCCQREGKARWVTTIPQPNSFLQLPESMTRTCTAQGPQVQKVWTYVPFYESFFCCYNKIPEVEVLSWGLFGSWLLWLESTNSTTLASQKETSGYIKHDEEGERQAVSSLFLKQSLLVTLARPWENYPISSEGDDFLLPERCHL